MDNFIEEQRPVNVQAKQEIDTVENSLNKELDGSRCEIDQKFDILQQSISKLTNQHVHQKEESPEEECLSDTIVDEQCQQQGLSESLDVCAVVYPWEKKEEILPLLTKEGNGKGAMEEHQEHNLSLPPSDLVYIMPSPAAHSTPETPAGKALSSTMPALQNIRKLVATVRAFATTSKTLAVAHT